LLTSVDLRTYFRFAASGAQSSQNANRRRGRSSGSRSPRATTGP